LLRCRSRCTSEKPIFHSTLSMGEAVRGGREAPLEVWANVKQRALDPTLKEINKHSDIKLQLEFTGRGLIAKY